MTVLYLAVPCYNEEEVLQDTTEKLIKKYHQLIAEKKNIPKKPYCLYR